VIKSNPQIFCCHGRVALSKAYMRESAFSVVTLGRELLEKGSRFRGGLVFKAHRLVYHSTLGLRVIKKKEEEDAREGVEARWSSRLPHLLLLYYYKA